MTHDTQSISHRSTDALASLGEELFRIAQALARVSVKLQEYARVKTVKVTKKTDPDMFTEEFIKTVKKSREDIEKGRVVEYNQFRNSLFS